MFHPACPLVLSPSDQKILQAQARAAATPQAVARKCKVILLASEGVANNEIAKQTGLSRPTVIATRALFASQGVQALLGPQRRKRPQRVLTPELEQRILTATLTTRPTYAVPWSVRTLARHLGLSRAVVHKVWQKHNLRPRRDHSFKPLQKSRVAQERLLLFEDSQFDAKVSDIIGLYLNPPDRALVLCVDPRHTADQTVSRRSRRDLTRPLTPQDRRYPTTTLFAAFQILQARVRGGDDSFPGLFRRFLEKLEKLVAPHQEIHIIMDNDVAYKSMPVQRWLGRKRRPFHFHFTAESSSWLRQVDYFFGLGAERWMRRRSCPGVQQLERDIYKWLARWDQQCGAFEWKTKARLLGGDGEGCPGEENDSQPQQEESKEVPSSPEVGSLVQWESQGVLQFQEPKRIVALSADRQWAFVEGSNTGLPVEQLTVVRDSR